MDQIIRGSQEVNIETVMRAGTFVELNAAPSISFASLNGSELSAPELAKITPAILFKTDGTTKVPGAFKLTIADTFQGTEGQNLYLQYGGTDAAGKAFHGVIEAKIAEPTAQAYNTVV